MRLQFWKYLLLFRQFLIVPADVTINVTGNVRVTDEVALAHDQDDDNDEQNDSSHKA